MDSDGSIPGDGWTNRKESRRRLLNLNDLPSWYEPISPYILTGYRPPNLSFCACASTLCEVHNETGNIWTHLIGGLVWVAASLDTLNSYDLASRSDDFTYRLHAVCLGLCGLMPLASTAAHLFHCRSASWYSGCWAADHVGILALWYARALCEGWTLLYCAPHTLWTNWAMLSTAVFSVSGWWVLSTGSTAAFLPLYAYIHLPIVYLWWTDGFSWSEAEGGGGAEGVNGWLRGTHQGNPLGGEAELHGFGLPLLSSAHAVGPGGGGDGYESAFALQAALAAGVRLTLLGSLCGVGGYVIRHFKVPEVWRPGAFDTWGSSHQWWHVLTMVGPLLCLSAGRRLLTARLDHNCPLHEWGDEKGGGGSGVYEGVGGGSSN